jgi:hypothetical protein
MAAADLGRVVAGCGWPSAPAGTRIVACLGHGHVGRNLKHAHPFALQFRDMTSLPPLSENVGLREDKVVQKDRIPHFDQFARPELSSDAPSTITAGQLDTSATLTDPHEASTALDHADHTSSRIQQVSSSTPSTPQNPIFPPPSYHIAPPAPMHIALDPSPILPTLPPPPIHSPRARPPPAPAASSSPSASPTRTPPPAASSFPASPLKPICPLSPPIATTPSAFATLPVAATSL